MIISRRYYNKYSVCIFVQRFINLTKSYKQKHERNNSYITMKVFRNKSFPVTCYVQGWIQDFIKVRPYLNSKSDYVSRFYYFPFDFILTLYCNILVRQR